MARATSFAAALLLLGPTVTRPVWANAQVGCQAERAGQRALLQIVVAELFDRELLRLVELGLEGRLHIEAALYRRRRFWMDARVAESQHVFTIAWSKPERRFLLDGRAITSPRRFNLPRQSLRPADESLQQASHYVEIALRLEVITASSLGQVARWMVSRPGQPTAEPDPAAQPAPNQAEASGTVLPRALVNYLAADLARTARGRCPVGP